VATTGQQRLAGELGDWGHVGWVNRGTWQEAMRKGGRRHGRAVELLIGQDSSRSATPPGWGGDAKALLMAAELADERTTRGISVARMAAGLAKSLTARTTATDMTYGRRRPGASRLLYLV
jgi:hypothetical protein